MEPFDRDGTAVFDGLDDVAWDTHGGALPDDGDTLWTPPPGPPRRDPGRGPARLVGRPQDGLPWSVVIVAVGTLVLLTFLQLLAMNMGASQGTTAAYLLSAALLVVSIAPLIAGRLWWERNRDTP